MNKPMSSNTPTALSARIKAERIRCRMTQRDLALKSGLKKDKVVDIERGKSKPNACEIVNISRALPKLLMPNEQRLSGAVVDIMDENEWLRCRLENLRLHRDEWKKAALEFQSELLNERYGLGYCPEDRLIIPPVDDLYDD